MALALASELLREPQFWNAERHQLECGTTVCDLGIEATGGLNAGRLLAEICLSGLGTVSLESWAGVGTSTAVAVATDHPLFACLGSQYAGWQIKQGKFFGMGSGPMRILAAKEPLIGELGITDQNEVAVGILETATMPTDEVCCAIAHDCDISPKQLYLFVAKTASLTGNLQIVARSVETAMHKLHALEFDLSLVRSGRGVAPLPPVAKNDVQGIGRTNDAILYGSSVTLWIDAPGELLAEVAQKLPSRSSKEYGRPFEEILQAVKFDFYQIDPLLFSPAEVHLVSLRDGTTSTAGRIDQEMLVQSFG